MLNKHRVSVLALAFVAAVSAWPSVSRGQTSQPTGGTPDSSLGLHPSVPLSATPGQWIQAAQSQFATRQNVVLREHGGATPAPAQPSVRTAFLVEFLENFFTELNGFLLRLVGLPVPAPDPGTPGGSTGPAIAENGVVWGVNQPNYLVIVTFVDAVDKQTAETAGNYTIGTVVATTAVLDAAEKVVTLTFNNASFPFDSDLTIALQNIKDKDNQAGQSATEAILANNADTTAPTAPTVALGTEAQQVTVTFSEVMDKVTAEELVNYLNVNNNAAPTAAVLGPGGQTVTLTFGNPMGGNPLRVSSADAILDINENAFPEQDVTVPVAFP